MLDRLKTFLHKQSENPSSPFAEEGDGVHVSLPELLAQKRFVPLLSFDALGFSKAEGLGLHRSPFRGRGMEFDEVRAYHQGDDIRLIDWRVTARTGKAHTKLYREERDRPVLFLAEFRPRMHFGTRKAFKSVSACANAVAFAVNNCVIFSSSAVVSLRFSLPPAAARAEQCPASSAMLQGMFRSVSRKYSSAVPYFPRVF